MVRQDHLPAVHVMCPERLNLVIAAPRERRENVRAVTPLVTSATHTFGRRRASNTRMTAAPRLAATRSDG